MISPLFITFLIVILILFIIGNMVQKNQNDSLQQENTDLIERNLELDNLKSILAKDALQDVNRILKLERKLKEAKELLSMQDVLIRGIE